MSKELKSPVKNLATTQFFAGAPQLQITDLKTWENHITMSRKEAMLMGAFLLCWANGWDMEEEDD
jgi:hypothetical protein